MLREAGLVAVSPDGHRRLYEIRTDGLESVRELLAELWPAKLQALKRVVEEDRR